MAVDLTDLLWGSADGRDQPRPSLIWINRLTGKRLRWIRSQGVLEQPAMTGRRID